MSVRREITEYDGIYFITITCSRWLHLFDLANGYDEVYRWFDHLKKQRSLYRRLCDHAKPSPCSHRFQKHQGVSINSIVGEGKRFMSYGIVKRLKDRNDLETLEGLSTEVNSTDKKRVKLHEVFEPSFDWKECRSTKFIDQKLQYIHANPCRGIWNLVKEEYGYVHSSAKYYSTGEQGNLRCN